MALNIDREKLLPLIRAFHTLTSIKIVLYDDRFREVLSYPEGHGAFCTLVHRDPALAQRCEESAAGQCTCCRQLGTLTVSRCHMGLTEAVAPLTDGHTTVGYLMIGQITDDPDRASFEARVLARCREEKMDAAAAAAALKTVRFCDLEQVAAVSQIVNTFTFYIQLERLVYPTPEPIGLTVLRYIDAHLSADLSVAALCRAFSLPRTQLYEIMHPYMPQGIAAFVRARRLACAEKLLRTTDEPVWRIADLVGFADYNYFQRVFRHEIGIPAARYRRATYAEEAATADADTRMPVRDGKKSCDGSP